MKESKVRILSITHCSATKSIEPILVPKKGKETFKAFSEKWINEVNGSNPEVLASDLYSSKGIKNIKKYGAGEDLYFVSGGLGLVHAQRKVVSYALTVAKDREVSLTNFINEPIALSNWWLTLTKGKYSEKSFNSLASKDDWILISLTLPYLEMLSEELLNISANLIIFSGNREYLSKKGLGAYLSPYTEVFDSEDSPLRGTKSEFAQRTHADFLKRLKDCSIDDAIKSVEKDMKTWRKPVKLNNKKLTDIEIIQKINDHAAKFASVNRLRQYFRHELNIACEEKRFAKLYRSREEKQNVY